MYVTTSLTSLATSHALVHVSSLLCFTSTLLPDRPSHINLNLSSLLLPFLAISSPHPSVICIFPGVMLLENVPHRGMTGTRRQRCLAVSSPLFSLREHRKLRRGFGGLRMTRWGHVWEKKGQAGICSSASVLEIQTQETCWKEDTHSCLTCLAI